MKDFAEIFRRHGAWPREQPIRLWWRSRSGSDSFHVYKKII